MAPWLASTRHDESLGCHGWASWGAMVNLNGAMGAYSDLVSLHGAMVGLHGATVSPTAPNWAFWVPLWASTGHGEPQWWFGEPQTRHGFAIFFICGGPEADTHTGTWRDKKTLRFLKRRYKGHYSIFSGARGGIIILLPVSETTVDNNSVPSSAPVQIAADTYYTVKAKPVDFFWHRKWRSKKPNYYVSLFHVPVIIPPQAPLQWICPGAWRWPNDVNKSVLKGLSGEI
jgi:hypothetical protein